MTTRTLEDQLKEWPSPAAMLQNSQMGPYVFPIAPQYTSWIEEVRAWRHGAVLLNQSYHMTDLYVRGPDALRLLSHVGVNSFAGFGRDKAKQLVCVNPDGYMIGDGILFGLEDDEYLYVGRPPLAYWIAYQAEILEARGEALSNRSAALDRLVKLLAQQAEPEYRAEALYWQAIFSGWERHRKQALEALESIRDKRGRPESIRFQNILRKSGG